MKSTFIIGGLVILAFAVLSGYNLFYKSGMTSKMDRYSAPSWTLPLPTTTNQNKTMPTTEQKVLLKTNYGDIGIALFADKAPKTVENFVKLSKSGFYDGTKFHRVIKDFMIQGGDPLSRDDTKKNVWGTGGPGYQFEDEINDVKLVRGVLGMANAGPDTNGSQFFIVTLEATPWLDGKHTAFGKIISGMEVVEKIEGAQTEGSDRPLKPIVIEKAIAE